MTKDRDFGYKLIPAYFKLGAYSGNVAHADAAWNSLAKDSSISKLVSELYFVLSEIVGDAHHSPDSEKSPDDPEVFKNWFRKRFIVPGKRVEIDTVLQAVECSYDKMRWAKNILE